MTSAHAGIASVLWADNISSVKGIQYCGGILVGIQSKMIPLVLEGGGGGIAAVHVWDSFSTVGDNISAVEVTRCSGDKDLKYYEFSKNLEIFSRAYFASKSDPPHHRPELLTTADMVKDLGYKNLVLGKILLCTYDRPGFWKYFVNFFGNCGRICEQFMIQGQSRSTA